MVLREAGVHAFKFQPAGLVPLALAMTLTVMMTGREGPARARARAFPGPAGRTLEVAVAVGEAAPCTYRAAVLLRMPGHWWSRGLGPCLSLSIPRFPIFAC